MAFSVFDIENALGSLNRGQYSSPVKIGDFALNGTEVPSVLRVGGQQRLVVHTLPGGDRIVDVAGNDPNRIALAGTFTGPDALKRAQELADFRRYGKLVRFVAPPISTDVFIADYTYDYASKGAVIVYAMTLEVVPPLPPNKNALLTPKVLSDLVGKDVASAITTVSNAASSVSKTVQSVAGQFQTVLGQVTPIANIVGLGGPLAKIQDHLQIVQGLAQAGTDFSQVPDAATQALGALQSAGDKIKSTLGQVGANINGMTNHLSPSGLQALGANAQLQTALVSAGGLVNRSARNLALVSGTPQAAPLVSAAA